MSESSRRLFVVWFERFAFKRAIIPVRVKLFVLSTVYVLVVLTKQCFSTAGITRHLVKALKTA